MIVWFIWVDNVIDLVWKSGWSGLKVGLLRVDSVWFRLKKVGFGLTGIVTVYFKCLLILPLWTEIDCSVFVVVVSCCCCGCFFVLFFVVVVVILAVAFAIFYLSVLLFQFLMFLRSYCTVSLCFCSCYYSCSLFSFVRLVLALNNFPCSYSCFCSSCSCSWYFSCSCFISLSPLQKNFFFSKFLSLGIANPSTVFVPLFHHYCICSHDLLLIITGHRSTHLICLRNVSRN